MRFFWNSVKDFEKEHLHALAACAAIMAVLGISFYVYLFKSPDYTSLAQVLEDGNYPSVIIAGEASLKTHPDDIRLIRILAMAYIGEMISTNDKSFRSKAIGFISSELKRYPKDAEMLRLEGLFYFDLGGYTQAEALYQQSAAIDQSNPVIWGSLGALYEAEGNFIKSLSFYNKALAIDNLDIQSNIGIIRNAFRAGDNKDARSIANNFLRKTNSASARASIYEILALDWAAQKQNLKAEQYFEAALALRPFLPVSLASYAQLLLNDASRKTGDDKIALLARAESLAKRAVGISDNYAFGYAVLSKIEAMKGDTAAAADAKARSLAALPNDMLTPVADKDAIGRAMSATSSSITNFKIISIKKIPAPISATTTMIKTK